MVRRAAAQKLGEFAENVDAQAVTSDLLPVFQSLTRDGKPHRMDFVTALKHVIPLASIAGLCTCCGCSAAH